MHRSTPAALIAATLVWTAAPAHALFHFAHISEVHTMLDGNASAQYVEIEMEGPAQTLVTNSVLHAWDCGGASLGDQLVVPGDLAAGGAGVRWIMATVDPIGGIAPDFVIPAAGLPVACGQICWGAPGIVPPDPATWDHTDPENYVDCVAYGGYTGATRTGSGAPTPLAPTAEFSLTAVTQSDDNAADFLQACPTPENNAGAVGGPAGACTPPTTTTTVAPPTTTSTTTTTLPVVTIDQPLAGTKLLLKTKPGKPAKSKLVLLAKDPALSIGAGPGSAEDPVENGGTFRIASGSSPGGAFTGTHTLTGAWKVLGKPAAMKGYKWKNKATPVRLVLIKAGKLLKAKGTGEMIGFDLDDDPEPVTVEVTIGARRYCLAFGGEPVFIAGKKYLAKKAAAPSVCP